MAAISLKALANYPNGHTFSAATTWQEFTLDKIERAITVHNEDASIAVYVAFNKMGSANAETKADGGAVGTHRIRLPAGTSKKWDIPQGSRRPASVFIASASGTPTVTIEPEID